MSILNDLAALCSGGCYLLAAPEMECAVSIIIRAESLLSRIAHAGAPPPGAKRSWNRWARQDSNL